MTFAVQVTVDCPGLARGCGRQGGRRSLVERGATVLQEGRQGPHTWVTMADPEGNEFCV